MDPQLGSDKKPYGPQRFQKIIEERFALSRYLHTSYNEIGEITPRERESLIQLMVAEMQKRQEMIDKSKAQGSSRR